LQLTAQEVNAVKMVGHRYEWADYLSGYIDEATGNISMEENEMWEFNDAVEADTEGGHSPFPMASPALADKLQSFVDQMV
jgi:hypothetical protein